MNTTFQPRYYVQRGENGPHGLLPSASIKVDFISQSIFEPRIQKHMNSIALEENPVGTSAGQISKTLSTDTHAITLKADRFADHGTSTHWISMPERSDEPAGDNQDGQIFDASMRALCHRKRTDNSMPDLKFVGFSVILPEAKAVQLAADFTDWDESAVDMIRFEGGVWSANIPLPPGIYAYRFLVDGEWYDDPRSVRRTPNSRGSEKAFVQVK